MVTHRGARDITKHKEIEVANAYGAVTLIDGQVRNCLDEPVRPQRITDMQGQFLEMALSMT